MDRGAWRPAVHRAAKSQTSLSMLAGEKLEATQIIQGNIQTANL